jgi:glyoxylase I family protein
MGSVDHIDLVVSDLDRSLAFYRGLLAPLGYTRESEITGERGERIVYLGHADSTAVGLRQAQSPGAPDRYAVGLHHLCFRGASREQVDERAAWAKGNGATIESEPREYDYAPGYYAFFADPDGLKLEIVHH